MMEKIEQIMRRIEELNILPLIEPFTRIDDNIRDINKKLEQIVGGLSILAEVRNKPTVSGYNDVLVVNVSKYKTKTVSLKLSAPMDVFIYLYDYETDLDYNDPFITIPYTEVSEYTTINITITDLYRLLRVVVKPIEQVGGDVVLCIVKGSLS